MPDELSNLIGAIYDTTLQAELWPSVIERIGLYVGTVAGQIYWQDIDRTATVAYGYGVDPRQTERYNATYIHLNPLYPAALFVAPGRIVTGGDLVPHDEFRQTRFYTEWVAPQGWVDTIGLCIQRYATGHAFLALLRAAEDGVVDEAARRRMALLAPHILRAVLIGRHIHRLDAQARGYEAVLDGHGAGVFLVAEGGRLAFANAAGRALLAAGEIVTAREGTLTSRQPRAARLLAAAASGALPADGERRSVSVALTDTAPRWLADVLPLRSGNRLGLARDTGASAAIFVRRAEVAAPSGIEIMAEIYKLRASEVRVLHAMTRGGGSNEALGEALGISGGTVKTHLNALFAKTGTSRRDELLRAVAAHGSPLI